MQRKVEKSKQPSGSRKDGNLRRPILAWVMESVASKSIFQPLLRIFLAKQLYWLRNFLHICIERRNFIRYCLAELKHWKIWWLHWQIYRQRKSTRYATRLREFSMNLSAKVLDSQSLKKKWDFATLRLVHEQSFQMQNFPSLIMPC